MVGGVGDAAAVRVAQAQGSGAGGGRDARQERALRSNTIPPPPPASPSIHAATLKDHEPHSSRVGSEYQAEVPEAPLGSLVAARMPAVAAAAAEERGDLLCSRPGDTVMLPAPRPRLSSANEQLFVVLMHLFPKKMQLVAKLMNLDVGTLLLHYYSTFKRSMEYRRFKGAANFGMLRGRLTRGERWRSTRHRIMSAAAPGSHATLAALFDKVDGSEGELEDFVTEVLPLVGPRAFASAFDLEARGARALSALTPAEFFEELAPLRTLAQVADALLYSSVGEVTQRVAFLRRMWPSLVQRGWRLEHGDERGEVFFLRPGAQRHGVGAGVEGHDYFDSIKDVLMHICISKDPTYNVIEFKHLTGGARVDACAKTAHAAREAQAPLQGRPQAVGAGGSFADPVEAMAANAKRFVVGRNLMVRDAFDGLYYQSAVVARDLAAGRLTMRWSGFSQIPDYELYANDSAIAPPMHASQWRCVDKKMGAWAFNDAKRKGGADKLKQSSGNDQNKGGAGLSGRDTTNVSNGGEHRDRASGDGAACKVTLEEEADTEVDTEVETEGESIADGDSGGAGAGAAASRRAKASGFSGVTAAHEQASGFERRESAKRAKTAADARARDGIQTAAVAKAVSSGDGGALLGALVSTGGDSGSGGRGSAPRLQSSSADTDCDTFGTGSPGAAEQGERPKRTRVARDLGLL